MSSKSPDPQHFSDYGFDPQINYLQVLEEAMKHKRDTSSSSSRSIDSIHFKLQKPISKDHDSRTSRLHKPAKKKRWWRNALFFFKFRWAHYHQNINNVNDVHQARARAFRASMSGPVYLTESRSGSFSPYYRTARRPSSGPLAGTMMPPAKGDVETPYLSLRDLNMEQQQLQQRVSTSAKPIYLVT
ncbi:hypothetical protein HN51_004393 [Arachis hypogaea]|uniref:Uncharacterized protein n=2 Tax=Arachis TaxID=3817 RepID=A0A444WQ08_ARAHY|nr:uncharacterized protein LOC107483556 [Arachis duranensis]XP_025694624.1 uncharacterized protein LOC112796408 [Arachis hypogaea]QHO37962.1 uncharacterized protein DS421_4g116150 [Arachis hypogaea]RYQ79508.1 hypothetical protein Ahy_Scaffold6g108263 [Arachis hypogaea]